MEVIEMVGRHLFESRREQGLAAKTAGWSDPLVDAFAAPAELRIPGDEIILEGVPVPLFQRAQDLDGTPIWKDEGIGHRVLASISGGALRLGFNPWVALGAPAVGLSRSGETGGLRAVEGEQVPWVDILASRLVELLAEQGFEVPPPRKWPDGASFALCLTHDVDRTRKTFQYVSHLTRRMGLRGGSGVHRTPPRAYWGFDAIREIESRAGVRSTFFVLHEGQEVRKGSPKDRILSWGLADFVEPRLAQEVRGLARAGWEIGLHSSLASSFNPSLVAQEKALLTDLLEKEPSGVRQHFLRLDLPERWSTFQAAGFAYDSSFGFSRSLGFRAGTAFPYCLWDNQGVLPLLEIPLHLMERSLTDEEDPLGALCRLLDHVRRVGGVVTILFHQRFFDDRNFPGFATLYEQLLAEAKRRGAWIATAGEVAKAWLA